MRHPLLAALLAAVTAVAPAPAAAEPEITVEAGRLTDAQIEAGARQFARSVLPVPSYGQYARWTQPVCPKVTGIADTYAAMVDARIRAAATAAGVPLAAPGCKSNLAILFSEDSRASMALIARRKPKSLSKLDGTQRERLLTAALPVRWWHVAEPTDGSGAGTTPLATALMSAQAGSGGQPLATSLPVGPDAIMTNGYNSSLIDTNLKLGITAAVVIVDIPLATGRSLDAVGDYVALVALSAARLPPEPPGVPSVLALFDSGAKGLTEWDQAYLAALYRIQLNRSADRQRGQLVSGIKAAFKP